MDVRKGDVLLMCSDGLSGMIRNNEIKDILLATTEPIEACRELTDRANQAGGHDNITVVVVRFDGPGVREITAGDEELAYRKYPLPDAATSAQSAAAPTVPARVATGPVSEEAERESRSLKVGHTMVGVVNPMADVERTLPTGEDPSTQRSPGDNYDPNNDPVELPTTGLPPSVVGALVVGALVLVLAMGFILLR